MDLDLEYLRPHFGRIIGDPKHITECIGDHCRKIVPLQTRTYATIQLEQLDKPTANYTLQHSLKMVAKFMLCDECRCPKSRAKIARKWIAERKKYLATEKERLCCMLGSYPLLMSLVSLCFRGPPVHLQIASIALTPRVYIHTISGYIAQPRCHGKGSPLPTRECHVAQ